MSRPVISNVDPKLVAYSKPVPESPDGRFSTPEWFSDVLKVPRASIARMQATSESRSLYAMLLRYFVEHAFAIGKEDPVLTKVIKPGAQLLSIFCAGLAHNRQTDDVKKDELLLSTQARPSYILKKCNKITLEKKPIYFLGQGVSQMRYNGKPILIVQSSTGPPVSTTMVTLFRTLDIFAAEQATLMEMVNDALLWDSLRRQPSANKFELFTLVASCGVGHWVSHGFEQSRALSTVILPQGMLDDILDDFRDFDDPNTKKWYADHGIPHRRSYLFYGPPGVGKTSTIRALAGTLNRRACFLSFGDPDIGNEQLVEAMRTIPNPSIIVIEDVDALFNAERKTDNESPLTFSALLNVLDGLLAAKDVISIMTTNHIERLYPALIRAGRIDRRFEFKEPSEEQFRKLFQCFYPEANEETVSAFAKSVIARPEKEASSISTLQEHFIYTRKKSAEESASMFEAFF